VPPSPASSQSPTAAGPAPPRQAAEPAASGAGLYLHVPFCSAVCPYCDFAVTTGGEASRRKYLRALRAEIALWRDALEGEIAGLPFDTVYLGGGTPSWLPADDLAAVLAALTADLPIAPAARLSLEANPEDVSAASAAAWRHLGVDTLSLGVQGFDAEALRFLGRRHDPRQARESAETALAAGFDSVSVDLIYGLPGQTADDLRRQLETAVALAPQHLSCYQLTIEPGTVFGARQRGGELRELPEPRQAELFRLTHRLLADAGYAAYEVSNFARAPEYRSRHNRKYWHHAPYLGLGPSAHSFDGRRRRWWNRRRLAFWRAAVERGERPVEDEEVLSQAQLATEALMLGLRTAEGVDLAAVRRRHGVDLAQRNADLLDRLVADGLARPDALAAGRLALTLDGWTVADGLAARFTVG
jgi:oxygen-independent coproporphyrinogen-3 oxidase